MLHAVIFAFEVAPFLGLVFNLKQHPFAFDLYAHFFCVRIDYSLGDDGC